VAKNDELRAAAERLRTIRDGRLGWADLRIVYPGCSADECQDRMAADTMRLATAYLARPPLTRELTESQLSLLSDVAGLCHSEANRWERSSPKTSEHWRKAAVELQAAYLAAHAMLADGLTRERVAEAVGELYKTRNGASSGRVMELLRDDRLIIRQFTPSVMTDELCRLLGVEGE
jgi:mannose/cellobiose epimerase-like protein (N-acyl-D-glucosamine 2-epimerase family)